MRTTDGPGEDPFNSGTKLGQNCDRKYINRDRTRVVGYVICLSVLTFYSVLFAAVGGNGAAQVRTHMLPQTTRPVSLRSSRRDTSINVFWSSTDSVELHSTD